MLELVGEGRYVPHGLRATAAIRLIEAGCSEDQAAAITGHRDLSVQGWAICWTFMGNDIAHEIVVAL